MSTVHPADDNRVFWRECSGLAAAGFDVTLIARADSDYKRNGVHVVAMRTYSRRLVRMTLGVLTALVRAVRTRSSLYHAHDPELIPALLVLRLLGKTVVYDAHERLSAQVKSKHYLPFGTHRAAYALARGLEKVIGRGANRVVAASGLYAKAFPPARVTVVGNYPDLTHFVPAADAEFATPARFGYVGGITQIRGINELVDAMEMVNATDRAVLRLVGAFGPAALQSSVSARPGWQHVEYAGSVPLTEVAHQLEGCLAGIVTYLPTPHNMIGSPNKVFEYMAMGLPVILSDFPAWRDMLDGVDCGLFVDPSDPASLAAAMRRLIHDRELAKRLGANGRAAVEGRLNWTTQLAALIEAYRTIGVTSGARS
jgi:glycosyltransferase involved in cell wall biosynthesis